MKRRPEMHLPCLLRSSIGSDQRRRCDCRLAVDSSTTKRWSSCCSFRTDSREEWGPEKGMCLGKVFLKKTREGSVFGRCVTGDGRDRRGSRLGGARTIQAIPLCSLHRFKTISHCWI